MFQNDYSSKINDLLRQKPVLIAKLYVFFQGQIKQIGIGELHLFEFAK
jgi:hypothetical protein